MQQVGDWLEKLGLPEYAQRFAENVIEWSVLRYLTDQDLKELGVSLGHRRKMLVSIAELVDAVATNPVPQPEHNEEETAERRQVTVLFCDLVGSTALAGTVDPEFLSTLIRRPSVSNKPMLSRATKMQRARRL